VGVRRWRELVADRKKMEGHCSTGRSQQWAVVRMEEEEEEEGGEEEETKQIFTLCHKLKVVATIMIQFYMGGSCTTAAPALNCL